MDSATDEDTNGSFEFVDKVTDSSESDEKHFEVIHDKKDTSSESSEKSHDFDDNNYNRSSEITVSELQKKDSDVPEYDDTEKKEADENNSENAEWLDILGSGNILKKVKTFKITRTIQSCKICKQILYRFKLSSDICLFLGIKRGSGKESAREIRYM